MGDLVDSESIWLRTPQMQPLLMAETSESCTRQESILLDNSSNARTRCEVPDKRVSFGLS